MVGNCFERVNFKNLAFRFKKIVFKTSKILKIIQTNKIYKSPICTFFLHFVHS
ncbi:hypothetical protein CSUNSWCD_1079 [Campylobacter showae CSUNSWCD]|uniref:Uncharacterized protein n=1 Tax=Campylobacter showae CSUNSWCD TaxID=1244083 RepID=M5IDA3_9BACT|nr:hypothetical protein CSUNSWCD_1079 [Campylobacter showae CSUNSWCD]